MKRVIVSCLVISMIAFAANAMAEGVKAGMKHVNFQIQYDDISVDDVNADLSMWIFGGKFGYFFTDFFALEVSGTYMNAEAEGDDASIYMIGLEPNFYFNLDNNIVPYAGLSVGTVGWDIEGLDDDNDWFYGGQIGILVFVNNSVALDFRGIYTQYEIEDTDVDDFGLRAGFSIFFE